MVYVMVYMCKYTMVYTTSGHVYSSVTSSLSPAFPVQCASSLLFNL